ncbi:Rab-like GTPase [Bodo saltans virus]|uniref:Rab-like GTPase n=1 Tax=Bodo saltans virus TaxID=2024608 RepID=A0A2H4UVD9_9VIRU|nr:Rab-like GTPase [Bodo saltans virus]ATZ80829.1 Rab-like GTPase [Bodo saltans virus]
MQKKKIILLGDTNVGKSSVINNYISNGNNVNVYPTIGNENYTKNINNYVCEIWDLSGSQKYQNIIEQMCMGAHVIFLFFDVSNEKSFINIGKWKDKALKYNNINDITIFLLGNKNDLLSNRVISQDKAVEFALSNDMMYFEISINDCFSIKQIFNTVTFIWSKDAANEKQQEIKNEQNEIISTNNVKNELNDELKDELYNKLYDNLQDKLCDNLKNKLYANFNCKLYDKLHNALYDELYNKIHNALCDELYNKIHNALYDELYNKIHNALYDELYNKLHDTLHGKLRDTLHGELYDTLHGELHDALHGELRDTLHGELYDTLHDELHDTLHDELYHKLHEEIYNKLSEEMINKSLNKQNSEIKTEHTEMVIKKSMKISAIQESVIEKDGYSMKLIDGYDENMFEENIKIYLKKIMSNVVAQTQNKNRPLNYALAEVDLLGNFIKKTIMRTRMYTNDMKKLKNEYYYKKKII